jgi:hypothetical protein
VPADAHSALEGGGHCAAAARAALVDS